MEIWKDIEGYEGLYQISNYGRVKSFERWLDNGKWGGYLKKKRILKHWNNKFGYPLVTLSVKNIQKHFLVHKLLAKSFIPNPHNKPFVNHKDGDKENYDLSNLEWCTREENDKHAMDTGLRINSGNRRKVRIYKGEMDLCFYATYYADEYIGCSKGGVYQVANPNNRHKTIFGWKAEFI